MHAVINPDYPFRVQLVIDSPQVGPFSNGSAFSPRQDVQIYVNGVEADVDSFSFDPANNRYLINMVNALAMSDVVQIIHHTPATPFQSSSATLSAPSTADITGTT